MKHLIAFIMSKACVIAYSVGFCFVRTGDVRTGDDIVCCLILGGVSFAFINLRTTKNQTGLHENTNVAFFQS